MSDILQQSHYVSLSGFTLLSVTGKDRHQFLHAQLINDLNLIETPAAQISAWCNPKGQVISNFLVINTGIAYLLLFKSDLNDYVSKRFSMFVLRADVKFQDITEQTAMIGVSNLSDTSIIATEVSSVAGSVQASDGLVVTCLPDNSNRYLLFCNKEIINNKLSRLADIMKEADISVWELEDIMAGLPWITVETQEKYLPQMLNLDSLNGLSYQKGCYPGQEVIARLHFKGKLKKRIHLIKTDFPVSIGDQIYLKDEPNHIGEVVNSAIHPDTNCYALAVIELNKNDNKLIIENDESKTVSIIELPYVIEPSG